MTVERLTRQQQRERTRSRLLAAASAVFSRCGMHRSSIDQIAAEAGYTKGAVYANFASKEDLFLALLETRFAERAAALDALLESDGSPAEHARAGGEDFMAYLDRDPEWDRLFVEFAAHAARTPEFRTELMARWHDLMRRMATALARYAEQTGLPFGGQAEAERFTRMIFAVANGVALHRTLDPEETPESLLADVLELLTLGAMAKAEREGAAEVPQPPRPPAPPTA